MLHPTSLKSLRSLQYPLYRLQILKRRRLTKANAFDRGSGSTSAYLSCKVNWVLPIRGPEAEYYRPRGGIGDSRGDSTATYLVLCMLFSQVSLVPL